MSGRNTLHDLYLEWAEHHRRALQRLRLLVVEDEPTVANVFTLILGDEGLTVEAVTTAEEARERIEAEHFDVAIVDKNLPGASGMELLAWISKRVSPIAVVMVTAYSSVESISEALEAGARDYIAKPFDDIVRVIDRITRVIDHHLGRSQHELMVKDLRSYVAASSLGERVDAWLDQSEQAAAARETVAMLCNDEDLAGQIVDVLTGGGVRVRRCVDADELAKVVEEESPLIALLELETYDDELRDRLVQADPLIHVSVFAAGAPRIDESVEAVARGAADFTLLAHDEVEVLLPRVQRAMDRARARNERLSLLACFEADDPADEALKALLALLPKPDRRAIVRLARKS